VKQDADGDRLDPVGRGVLVGHSFGDGREADVDVP
jgi:hypothetical protein